jgi:hypothetical protein
MASRRLIQTAPAIKGSSMLFNNRSSFPIAEIGRQIAGWLHLYYPLPDAYLDSSLCNCSMPYGSRVNPQALD